MVQFLQNLAPQLWVQLRRKLYRQLLHDLSQQLWRDLLRKVSAAGVLLGGEQTILQAQHQRAAHRALQGLHALLLLLQELYEQLQTMAAVTVAARIHLHVERIVMPRDSQKHMHTRRYATQTQASFAAQLPGDVTADVTAASDLTPVHYWPFSMLQPPQNRNNGRAGWGAVTPEQEKRVR